MPEKLVEAPIEIDPSFLIAKDAPFLERLAWDQELAETVQISLLNRLASEIQDVGKKTPATQRQYNSDLKRFRDFCDVGHAMSLPAQPEFVALFLLHEVDENGASYATIQRMRAAISWAHKTKKRFDPTGSLYVLAAVHHIAKMQSAFEVSDNAQIEGAEVSDEPERTH